MQKHGEVLYMPEIEKNELSKLLKKDTSINAIFTNPNKQNYKLDKEVLAKTGIKVINTASTGLNHIDVKVLEELGIKLLSLTKDFELLKRLPSTSELAFGLLLSLARYIPASFDAVKRGEWNYENHIGNQLEGLTAGIIGHGRLGYFMAKYCEAFGMKVLINDPYVPAFGYDKVSLDELAEKADIISLHVHVTDETRHLINESVISKFKRKPFLINTSRGEIVDELAVIKGIKNGKIRGYGADVIEDEFGNRDKSPMIKAAREGLNIILTPHVGGMTWEGQQRAFMWTAKKFATVKL